MGQLKNRKLVSPIKMITDLEECYFKIFLQKMLTGCLRKWIDMSALHLTSIQVIQMEASNLYSIIRLLQR
jgi:hypothetical protein